MGSNKQGQNLDFVNMSVGGFNVKAHKDSMELEPQNPNPVASAKAGRTKGVVPLETPEEDAEAQAEREAAAKAAQVEAEQRLRERIREELKAEVTDKVRAELEAEMTEKQEDEQKKDLGLAKASPTFKTIEPKVEANEKDLDDAIEDNAKEVD